MTQDEIIEMARQAGCPDVYTEWAKSDWSSIKGLIVPMTLEQLVHCAKLVAAKAIAELESQEPVAWVAEDVCEGQHIDGRPRKIWWECKKGVGKAFYTHPSQRTWVGLTNKEVFEICYSNYYRDSQLVKMVEAKLKEKNT